MLPASRPHRNPCAFKRGRVACGGGDDAAPDAHVIGPPDPCIAVAT
jgi:hypothetical protein